MSKRFAVLGVGGFVAPRHLQAIKDVGGEIVATCDPHDAVGVLDSYAPQAAFFTEVERFDRHLEKLRQAGKGVDFVSICTPNYLHDAHCRLALRLGAAPIVEKPAVLRPSNLDALLHLSRERGVPVYPILQARLHPQAQAFLARMAEPAGRYRRLDVVYKVRRGTWYRYSWKGDPARSGGVHLNLGIHLYDLLALACPEIRYFGDLSNGAAVGLEDDQGSCFGRVELDVVPDAAGATRVFQVREGDRVDAFDLSTGFESLHTAAYRAILDGSAPTLEAARPGLVLASAAAGA